MKRTQCPHSQWILVDFDGGDCFVCKACYAPQNTEKRDVTLFIGGYAISKFSDHSIWMTRYDGKGMEVNIDTLWKEHLLNAEASPASPEPS